MQRMILFSIVAALVDGLLPEGRVSDSARMAMGLVAVKLVVSLIVKSVRAFG